MDDPEHTGSLHGLGGDDDLDARGSKAGAQGAGSREFGAGTGHIENGQNAPVPPANTVGLPQEELVAIILEEAENMPPTGQPFGLNGRTFILKPGVKAMVPRGIINILNDAVMTVPVLDPSTKKVVGSRERLRFNYRFV